MAERFERTGEYRKPLEHEWFEDRVDHEPTWALGNVSCPCWILRRIDKPEQKPETAKKPVYETPDEVFNAIAEEREWCEHCTQNWCDDIRACITKHIACYRPGNRDAVIEECCKSIRGVIRKTVCHYERDGLHNALVAVRSLKSEGNESLGSAQP